MLDPDPATDDDALVPGALLAARYRLATVASRSAHDVVFNALDERSRQRVRVRLTSHPVVPELALVRHPSVVGVVRHGRHGRQWYTVLEWFDGAPCRLPARPPSGPEASRAWATAVVDVLDALAVAHAVSGRAHGAFGLHSLWEGADGRLRVIDLAAPDAPIGPDAVPWASPERLHGVARDVRSDVYALAAVAWGLATGRPPFGADPAQARVGHLLRGLPETDALPPRFVAVLGKALDKQPHRRHATMARLREALGIAVDEGDAAADLEPSISVPGPPRRHRTRPPPPVVPLVVVSSGLALSLLAWVALAGVVTAIAAGRLSWPL